MQILRNLKKQSHMMLLLGITIIFRHQISVIEFIERNIF